MDRNQIHLRSVRVNNLKSINLDLPLQRLIGVCGVSGSGKTSLALDTLYAEGQRRYLESFSAYTRQFLERLSKPEAERIDNLPAAVAVEQKSASQSGRSTIGAATEIVDYLRLLFAKVGRVFCQGCGRRLRRESPHSVARLVSRTGPQAQLLVGFEVARADEPSWDQFRQRWLEAGLLRVVVDERLQRLDQALAEPDAELVLVVVDRLKGQAGEERLADSLELAFLHGKGAGVVLIDTDSWSTWIADACVAEADLRGAARVIDGRSWMQVSFQRELRCEDCGRDYPSPEPRLYSFNSPLGACRTCEGFGSIIDIDLDLVVPDRSKSLRDGAIAPWNTPAYSHELEELLALASEEDIPVDTPVSALEPRHWDVIQHGVPRQDFGGLDGFFAWLERRKYKMHIRVFLSRWRRYYTCPDCGGNRLRSEALATRVGEKNIAEICALRVADALQFLNELELDPLEQQIGRVMLDQVRAQLGYLDLVGVGYLTLDRTLRSLSGGEAQRVALSSAMGSNLVNMLYVLDEPTTGLHPDDTGRLVEAISNLHRRGNTVVVVEHDAAVLRSCEHLVEIGPGAGERGGEVVFQGDMPAMLAAPHSLTGSFLSGRRGMGLPQQRRRPRGKIQLIGARGNNLQNLTVDFPLGLMCLVTGVSGSGKSTLVQDTLYGALCRRKRKEGPTTCPYDDVIGDGQVEDVVMIDSSPIGRSPRSNPVTYLKAFDPIRAVFADTIDARTHNYSAGHFSFNVDGGRCTHCRGDGYLKKDMQFLADVYMKCDQCQGKRYRKEILDVRYRGKNVAEVLDMTVREAFSFFRRETKIQARLKQLIDVGLDYLRLGQPANTLSRGEAQRVKLAAYMASSSKSRILFLMDEPTAGLHFADVVKLLDCLEALLNVGHSLIIVEHSLQLMRAADWIVDIGPGAGDAGGRIVAQGTPETLIASPQSITGRYLAEVLQPTAEGV